MQKLFMLNSPFVIERSRALAARLSTSKRESDSVRVARVYETLFAREPKREEIELATEFLRTATNDDGLVVTRPSEDDLPPWTQYVQMLLASNEMLYID